MIGIIGAMDKEIDDLKAVMTGSDGKARPIVEKHAGMSFWIGSLNGHEIVVVRSGVGKVNAAVATEAMIAYYNVNAVINTGIAGSLDARINIGDIVLSIDTLEHDMNVEGLGYEKGIVPNQEISIYEANEKLRKLAKEGCEKACPDVNVFEGRIVSGDIFVSDQKMKDNLVEDFNGMCTEMEGAAIAHAAWLNNTPFLIIRSISDKADNSAVMDYPSFQKVAIDNSVKLVSVMMSLIERI